MAQNTALETIQPKAVMRGDTETNPALVYLASLAPSGRRSMATRLTSVSRILGYSDPRAVDWAALRFEHLAAIRARISEGGLSPATVNATLCALRGVARAAWNLGQMNAEDFQRINSVKSVKGERLPAGRALGSGEIAALMNACAADPSPAGARDAALFALLVGCGLRRSETVVLDVSDYDPETGALRVRGKGNKERTAYLTGGAAQAMNDWLRVRGAEPGPLLNPILKSGLINIRRMTDQAIYNAMVKRAAEAKVKSFSPHDLRRTFVSELLDAGADIAAVQRLAGHAKIETTARYDRRGEAAKLKAAQLIHLPYQSRF